MPQRPRPPRGPRRPPPQRRPAPRRLPRGPAPKVHLDLTAPVHVEIVCVGREMLRGRVREDVAAFVAAHLSQRGALVHRITVVDDRERAVAAAVTEALDRGARLVVTTGGLGPASDDRTLRGVSDALRLPLAIHPRAKEMVEEGYRRLRSKGLAAMAGLTPSREKICTIPLGAEPVANPAGTAPGVIVRRPGGSVLLCLPGVPEEARETFLEAMKRLRDVAPRAAVAERTVETPTADESSLTGLLDRLAAEFPAIWIQSRPPRPGSEEARIRVTLEASAPTREEAESAVEIALRRFIALASGSP